MRGGRVALAVLAVVSGLLVARPSLGTAAAHDPILPLEALSHRPVCGPPEAGSARCHARIVVDNSGSPLATTAYSNGYQPSDLASAYRFTLASGSSTPSGQTVAVVDAYDNPNAENDLAAYRAQFGLPPCTSASGCFTKVDEWGGKNYPSPDTGWGQEIDLDLDMVSATCGNCRILLVEAASNSFNDLAAAVDRATAMQAAAISNSYGAAEFSSESTLESHYNHPGVAVTVSSGDNGYGVEFPAASRFVTAVGGTSLRAMTSTRGWSETAWSGAGSGCSAYIIKPAWQTDSGCSGRTVADVAAVADPNTGVAVYDSYGSSGGANWFVFGGTSVASPIIASLYGLAGNASGLTYGSSPYHHPGSLFDVTSGTNGHCRRGATYLCTAGPGYDGPSGLGTPNGIGAF